MTPAEGLAILLITALCICYDFVLVPRRKKRK